MNQVKLESGRIVYIYLLFITKKLLYKNYRFPTDDHQLIFSNIQDILDFHRDLFSSLQSCSLLPPDSQLVGKAILDLLNRFIEVYTEYCVNLNTSIDIASRLFYYSHPFILHTFYLSIKLDTPKMLV